MYGRSLQIDLIVSPCSAIFISARPRTIMGVSSSSGSGKHSSGLHALCVSVCCACVCECVCLCVRGVWCVWCVVCVQSSTRRSFCHLLRALPVEQTAFDSDGRCCCCYPFDVCAVDGSTFGTMESFVRRSDSARVFRDCCSVCACLPTLSALARIRPAWRAAQRTR